jgi:hypothetical protein
MLHLYGFTSIIMNTLPFTLRPGVTNAGQWQSSSRTHAVSPGIRKTVLSRDNNSCVACAHQASKWMHIHHLGEGDNDSLDNLCTLCVACHAIVHMGRSLQYGAIEIWKTTITQVEIVQATRAGVRAGLSLQEINTSFALKKGRRVPNSAEWANSLLREMDPMQLRAELAVPLCAVFVSLKQWQIES